MVSEEERIGSLVKGRVVCRECVAKEPYVRQVPLFRVNIGDYKQCCSRCKKVLVVGKTPAWPQLFD